MCLAARDSRQGVTADTRRTELHCDHAQVPLKNYLGTYVFEDCFTYSVAGCDVEEASKSLKVRSAGKAGGSSPF
jgi:hypothetical protein